MTQKEMLKILYFAVNQQGGQSREMLTDAYFAYLKAVETHNENRAQLSTWIVYRVRRHVQSLQRKEKRRKEVSLSDWNTLQERSRFSFESLLREISDDARTVISLVFESPGEIFQALDLKTSKEIKPLKKRNKIRLLLSKLGWTASRISETFREIGEALS